MEKWEAFYSPYFNSDKELKHFISTCENLTPDNENHRAKIMMHQGQRLISLADNSGCMDRGRDPLKLLFLLIATEAVSKLHDNYFDGGHSKKYVISFFEKFSSDEDKQLIIDNIEIRRKKDTSLEDIIQIFYAIRCDVVHEGKYWNFHFANETHRSIFNFGEKQQVLKVTLHYKQLRDIIAKSIIRAINDLINS